MSEKRSSLRARVLAEVSRAYEQRVMNNVHRSDYVEAIVAVALADYGWTRKAPWEGWDCDGTVCVVVQRARQGDRSDSGANQRDRPLSSRGITAETALRLARYFGTDAQSWMNLQDRYELAVAERRVEAQTRWRRFGRVMSLSGD